MEALKSYTINGAYAAFEENNRGSLKVGKYADVTVLSKDILKVPSPEVVEFSGHTDSAHIGSTRAKAKLTV